VLCNGAGASVSGLGVSALGTCSVWTGAGAQGLGAQGGGGWGDRAEVAAYWSPCLQSSWCAHCATQSR
jgi:hypothetical protein